MAEKELNENQVVNMISIIAAKHRATIHDVDFESHQIEAECPEEVKVAFAIEVSEFLQNVSG